MDEFFKIITSIFNGIWYPFVNSFGNFVIFLVVFMILRKPVINIIFKILEKITKKTKTKSDDEFVLLLKKPLKIFITITALYISYKMVDLTIFNISIVNIVNLNDIIYMIYRSSFIVLVFYLLYNSVGDSKIIFIKVEEVLDIKIDKLLIPFIAKIFKLILIIMCIAAVSSEWGFNINGFVTGLGIGGLAFALAAKDTLANAFGGAVLITEKPFTIGDWIIVSGVEGTVEDINFRSTKIRKFNKSVVTVPNSIIATSNIINYSKRDIRRVSYDLKIRIETPINSLKNTVDEIEKMLVSHSGIDKETIFVRFNKFGESSLDIFLYYFTNTSVWSEYLELTEDTNYKILEILQKNDVKLAVPMQVIKVEK